MAVPGDVVSGIQSVTTNATYDIRPPAGQEWIIHNIYYNQGTVEIYKTDGTNLLLFDTDDIKGGILGASFHVTNTYWIQLKNTAATNTLFGYDGIQTK